MSTKTIELLSMRAYAKRRGCDVAAVSRQVNKGRITLTDGKINPLTADREWANTTRARLGTSKPMTEAPPQISQQGVTTSQIISAETLPPPARSHKLERDDDDEDYGAARCRRERSEADKSEIELAQLQASLINREGIEMALETAFRQIRDTIMSVPDRLPIDKTHRTMFRDALRDTLTDALKMLPTMMAREPLQ